MEPAVKRFSLATLSTLVALVVLVPPAAAAPKAHNTARERPDVYTGVVSASGLRAINALGIDRHELDLSSVVVGRGRKARMRVEVIITGRLAAALAAKGVELSPTKVRGLTAAQRATARAAQAMDVFRPYSGAGGL
jgi:hypothetical protein